jgi:hypothetical protein
MRNNIFVQTHTNNMKTILPGLIALLLVAGSCSPIVYKAADFDTRTAGHKTVAILPAQVDITLRPAEMEKTSPEQVREMEKKTGESIQDKLYSWLLNRSDKYKFTVSFQDISKTNALLYQAGIDYAALKNKTKEELAKLLGVDAVMSIQATMKKPMSEGAAIAVGVVFGAWGVTNEVQTAITIHEATKGDLVWKYDFMANGSVGRTTENLVNALMRNASRKFPYNAR